MILTEEEKKVYPVSLCAALVLPVSYSLLFSQTLTSVNHPPVQKAPPVWTRSTATTASARQVTPARGVRTVSVVNDCCCGNAELTAPINDQSRRYA